MKINIVCLFVYLLSIQFVNAQVSNTPTELNIQPTIEQSIIQLSKNKWDWMAEKNIDSLSLLFDAKCEFVHMGGTWGKDRELDIIKGGFIGYKKATLYSTDVKFYGNTAIILTDIDLVAVVGGNEAINPFVVTEVYVKEAGKWKLAQLTFSHLARPLKLTK